ncbi:hypothetical protein EDC04DRAFT_2675208 [Pisolithus marmoratus]|nr:hypothetical protein EDC04DRAFT_2675208 [Pisolithus marmoratus]
MMIWWTIADTFPTVLSAVCQTATSSHSSSVVFQTHLGNPSSCLQRWPSAPNCHRYYFLLLLSEVEIFCSKLE